MTPAARIASAIELVALVLEPWGEGTQNDSPLPLAPSREGRGPAAVRARPADAVANDFFRARRFIGSGDRRDISERVWRVLRSRRRLGWWLGDHATSRLLVAASLLLEGVRYAAVAEAFSGGRFARRV